MIIGLLGAPFSYREDKGRKPGVKEIANETFFYCEALREEGHKVIVVLHFKVAKAWRKLGYPEDRIYEVVGKLPGGTVLKEGDVDAAARQLFKERGVVRSQGLLDQAAT